MDADDKKKLGKLKFGFRIEMDTFFAVVVLVIVLGAAFMLRSTVGSYRNAGPITGLAGGGGGFACSDGANPGVQIVGNPTVEVGSGSSDISCWFIDAMPDTKCDLYLWRNHTAPVDLPSSFSVITTSSSPVGCPSTNATCQKIGFADKSTPYSFGWKCKSPGWQQVLCIVLPSAFSGSASIHCVDTTHPTVDITSPANGATVDDDVTFACNATDNWDISSVKLWIQQGAGTWTVNKSTTGISGATHSYSTTVNNMASGAYNWKCEYTDDQGLSTNSTTYALTVSPTQPTVSVSSPSGAYDYSQNIPLLFTQTSADSCVYSLDGAANQTIASCTNMTVDVTSDGNHSIIVSVINGDKTASDTANFTVNASPVVTLVAPDSFSSVTTDPVVFTYNVSSVDTVSDCNLYIDDTLNQTNTSITTGTNQTFNAILANGAYLWNVECTNPVGSVNSTQYFVEVIPSSIGGSVNISLTSPSTGHSSSSSTIEFTYSVNSVESMLNCSFLVNDSINVTDDSLPVSSSFNSSFNATLADGTYTWAVRCFDTGVPAANGTSSSRTITVDTSDNTAPVVALSSPVNQATDTDGAVTFAYTATDASSISSCTLLIDNVAYLSASNVPNATVQQFSKSLSDGAYTWTVRCTDSLSNQGTADSRSITVAIPSTSTGSSGSSPSNYGTRRFQTWNAVSPNTLYKLDTSYAGMPVKKVLFETPDARNNVRLEVKEIRTLSKEIVPPIQNVYAYFTVDTKSLEEPSNAAIVFSVRKAWVREKGAPALFRFEDSVWKQYAAELVSQDNSEFVYSTSLPGFSTFAIATANPGSKDASTSTSTPSEPKLPSYSYPGQDIPGGSNVNDIEQRAQTPLVVIFIIFIVALIVVLGSWWKASRTEQKQVQPVRPHREINTESIAKDNRKVRLSPSAAHYNVKGSDSSTTKAPKTEGGKRFVIRYKPKKR
ncbi:MAG: PGF-pre-PGF domain-containing protein [Candidatus Woesearchaeota archaeon]